MKIKIDEPVLCICVLILVLNIVWCVRKAIWLHDEPKYTIIEEGILIPPNVSLSDVISCLDPNRASTIKFTQDGYLLQFEEE